MAKHGRDARTRIGSTRELERTTRIKQAERRGADRQESASRPQMRRAYVTRGQNTSSSQVCRSGGLFRHRAQIVKQGRGPKTEPWTHKRGTEANGGAVRPICST